MYLLVLLSVFSKERDYVIPDRKIVVKNDSCCIKKPVKLSIEKAILLLCYILSESHLIFLFADQEKTVMLLYS